ATAGTCRRADHDQAGGEALLKQSAEGVDERLASLVGSKEPKVGNGEVPGGDPETRPPGTAIKVRRTRRNVAADRDRREEATPQDAARAVPGWVGDPDKVLGVGHDHSVRARGN